MDCLMNCTMNTFKFLNENTPLHEILYFIVVEIGDNIIVSHDEYRHKRYIINNGVCMFESLEYGENGFLLTVRFHPDVYSHIDLFYTKEDEYAQWRHFIFP